VTDQPDDATVIARSLTRPEEFGVIFERHFDEIHRYLRRRHPQEADELASEVFMQAFDARARYQPLGETARPWLYGIASRLLLRRWRSEVRGLRAHSRSGGRRQPAEDEFGEALQRADAQRQSAQIAAALAGLNQGDRDALLLYALSDLSYDEVAQALDLPIGTVRSRLARARRQCEQQLAAAPSTAAATEEGSHR
jgi:RNA polymerase sigma factor (sigma-70 family)